MTKRRGEIFGPRGLHRLQRATGLPLTKAGRNFRRGYIEGVIYTTHACVHYRIDVSGEYEVIPQGEGFVHWLGCPAPSPDTPEPSSHSG